MLKIFTLILVAAAAEPTASGPAAASPSTVTKVPTSHSAPLKADSRSKKLESKQEKFITKKKQVTCADEIGQPCQANGDCGCSKFCEFVSSSPSPIGACAVYNRESHN